MQKSVAYKNIFKNVCLSRVETRQTRRQLYFFTYEKKLDIFFIYKKNWIGRHKKKTQI